MNIYDSIIDLISAEFHKSPIPTITGLLAIIGTLYKFIKFFSSSPVKVKSQSLLDAGVPYWALKIFVISIPTKRMPENTLFDKFFHSSFIVLCLGSALYFLAMHNQIYKAPDSSSTLVYKPTKESFYITEKSAKGASLFFSDSWELTPEKCSTHNEGETSIENIPSTQLKDFICSTFNSAEGKKNISDSVSNFNKYKKTTYLILTVTEIVLIWLSLSLVFNLYYTKKVRKYIIFQNNKAMSYIT